jgi:hypothetical protein
LVVAAVLVGGVGVAGWLATTGRAPALTQALSAAASAIGAPSSSVPADGDAATVDAAPRPVKRQTAPLSSAQLGAPLVNGHFVTACGAPDTMKVVVKATVKRGRAVDVDVITDPPDTAVCNCVRRFTEDQRWDISPRPGKVTVRY